MADQREPAKKLETVNASVMVIVQDIEEEVQRNAIRNVWLKCKDTLKLGLHYREAVDLVVKALEKFF